MEIVKNEFHKPQIWCVLLELYYNNYVLSQKEYQEAQIVLVKIELSIKYYLYLN